MRLSEEQAEHARTLRLMLFHKTNASSFHKAARIARAAEEAAAQRESDARRQVTLAERETRSAVFQNLTLTRKLTKFSDTVPRAEYGKLQSQVDEQAQVIARLQAELGAVIAERDAASEGEISEVEGEEGGGAGGRSTEPTR